MCKAHPMYSLDASSGGYGLTIDFEEASLVGEKRISPMPDDLS